MIEVNNINELRKEIDKSKDERIIVVARDEDFNRKVLENKKVYMLLFNDFFGKDKLKQRDSGLNHVLCKIARDNDIKIGIDVKKLFSLSYKELSFALARVSQNVELCRKFKVDIILVNVKGKDKEDLKAFMLTLGADTLMAKKAVENGFEV